MHLGPSKKLIIDSYLTEGDLRVEVSASVVSGAAISMTDHHHSTSHPLHHSLHPHRRHGSFARPVSKPDHGTKGGFTKVAECLIQAPEAGGPPSRALLQVVTGSEESKEVVIRWTNPARSYARSLVYSVTIVDL